MQIGSRAFTALIAALSLAALAGGYLLSLTPLIGCGVVIGLYALHLVSVAKAAGDSTLADDLRAERQALEREREEIERTRKNLERKAAQVEEQWRLLRSMVQKRVRGVSQQAKPPGSREEPSAARTTLPDGSADRRSAADDPGRSYGRW